MRTFFRASLRLARTGVLCLIGLAPTLTTAEDLLSWREARTMEALVADLDGWLDANTDLPVRSSDPNVRLVSQAEAAAIAPDHNAAGTDRLRGLYDNESQTIWLVHPWDPRNPFDVSVLLHELVHHRQAEAGHWYCDGAQELPAYRLQQQWLNRMGLEPNVNWIAVVLEAGCTPRDIHPD